MIHVIAIIEAKPGQRELVLGEFKANMQAVHAEAGCIEYQPVTDVADAGPIQTQLGDNTFMVIEKWETLPALQAHAQSAHMAAYAAKVKDHIASRTVHVLETPT